MAQDQVPPAKTTCLLWHNPGNDSGDTLMVKTSFGDDENNSVTHSLVLVHVGGRDLSGRAKGSHGAHLGHIEFIATDNTNQTIPWVAKINDDGSAIEYASSDAKTP